MRKSWVRLLLGVTGAFVLFGQASAQSQSVNFWYNSLGDPAANQPSVIDVVSGTSITLSIYAETQNIGPLTGINLLFGYSTTTVGGFDPTGSNRSDAGSHMADETGYTWATGWSDLGGSGTAGGSGPSDGTVRPWGWFASAGYLGNNGGVGTDGSPSHEMDITLSILAAPGTDIPVSIWGFPGSDSSATAVLDENANEYYPSPYNGTLHVIAAPEPASMSILGIGVLALLRRRRR